MQAKLFYGTAWKKERTSALVQAALRKGFRAIDTAGQPEHYYEPGVGQALFKLRGVIPREDIFLQTKFSPYQDPALCAFDWTANFTDQVSQSVALSLQHLQTSYIDSLLLHCPVDPFEDMLEIWRAMESYVYKGTVKQLGISNIPDLNLLKKLCAHVAIKPKVVQNRFYRQSHFDRTLRKWCKEQEIMYQSFWSLTANPDIVSSRAVQEIASHLQVTREQVFLRFLTHQDIVPLSGTCSEVHMEQDVAMFKFELRPEEISRILKELNQVG